MLLPWNSGFDKEVNEAILFHGTEPEKMFSIAKVRRETRCVDCIFVPERVGGH